MGAYLVKNRGLFLEDKEFVADEVPNEREAGCHQFGDIGPEENADAKEWGDKCRNAGQYGSVDDDTDNTNDKKA